MLDLNNLRKEKHEGICKIFDFILVALLAVFFILSLFPYYSVSEGEMVVSRGYEAEAPEDDSWSLLGYVGFPYNHLSVEEWQETQYKENKKTIKENENNGYDGLWSGLAGKMGITLTNEDGEKNPYQELAVPGITTKTVSIKQVGAILALDIMAIIGIVILLLKKGVVRAGFCVVWGVIGVLALMFNYLMNMSTTFVRPAMLAVTVIALAIALVDTIFYIIDGRSRAKYLRSVSAAYA